MKAELAPKGWRARKLRLASGRGPAIGRGHHEVASSLFGDLTVMLDSMTVHQE